MSATHGTDVGDSRTTDFECHAQTPPGLGKLVMCHAGSPHCNTSFLISHLAGYLLKVINCTFPLLKGSASQFLLSFTFIYNLWFAMNNTDLPSPAEKVQFSDLQPPLNCQESSSSSCLAASRAEFRVSPEICPRSLLKQLRLSLLLLGWQCGTGFSFPSWAAVSTCTGQLKVLMDFWKH